MPGRWLRQAPILLIAALSACSTGLVPGTVHLRAADRVLAPGDAPPAASAAWETVSLPDFWDPGDRLTSTEGWYRLHLELDRAPEEPWAVHVIRVSMNTALWVNGRLIGDGGRFTPEIARNWNRPLFFVLPVGTLRAGANDLFLRVATPITSPGYMDAVVVGPEDDVRPGYESQHFRQETLAYIALSALLVTLLLTVRVARQDQTGAYRWFAAGVVFWMLQAIDTIVRDVPLPAAWWEWLVRTAYNWDSPCFVFAVHRALGLERPRLERFLIVAALFGAVGMALVPPEYVFNWWLGWIVWTLTQWIYLTVVMVRAVARGDSRYSKPFLAAVVLSSILAAHDVVGLLTPLGEGSSPLALFIPAVLIVAAGWATITRFADALGESEALNRELEARVAEKHAELERNYERLNALEGERATAAERERLVRDMHDGLGGQLVSTLALVESGRFTADALATAIREALDDLRLMIDSMDPGEEDIVGLLAQIRSRLEPRLVDRGIRFDWQVSDLPPLPELTPGRALQVLRIVQEAITNVLKHSGASRITVRTGVAADVKGRSAYVEIADDGRGLDASRPTGRGIENMRRRAQAAGGCLSLHSGSGGTTVRLDLGLGPAG